MKIHPYSIVISIGLLVMGCSETLQLGSARWSSDGPAPARPRDFDGKAAILSVGEKKLIFQSQKIDGVEIEGSYYKEIGNSSPEFVASRWADHIPWKMRTQVLMMKSQIRHVEKKFSQKHPEYDLKDLVEKPTLLVRNGEAQWKFVFQVPDGSLEGIFLNRDLKIQETQRLGSHLDTPSATLFPDGPLKSQLQRVLLAELMGNRTLVSPRIRVLTQSPQRAEAQDSQFLYPVDDQRFEQVQVFFYLSKALRWAESRLHFQLPFALEAETSVGYPEKTNAAFYYQQKIRLGDGDESTFSHIPLDPSIVVHESFHSVIEAVARLPYEGEGGSLNEGFADTFTALVLDNPKMGEASYRKAPFKRTVDNSMRLSEKNGGLYHDSGIVSGLLWTIQKSLGKEAGTSFIWEVLLRLNPDSHFADLKVALKEIQAKLPADQQIKVQSILSERGWVE